MLRLKRPPPSSRDSGAAVPRTEQAEDELACFFAQSPDLLHRRSGRLLQAPESGVDADARGFDQAASGIFELLKALEVRGGPAT